VKLGELAPLIGAGLLGDGELEVTRVRAADEAGDGDLAFASAAHERRDAFSTRATAVLVDEDFAAEHAHELPCAVLVGSPASRALSRAIEVLHPPLPKKTGIDARAVLDPHARVGAHVYVGPLAVVGAAVIGAGASIGPLAVVSDGVEIGEGASIGPGAVLLAGTRVGARVVVGPGAILGDEGFVYAPEGAANVPVRHVAGVVVEDDAEVGANACIDAGGLRDTRVGRGTKVDNLVQIAHDVVVGENAVIVAQVGVAGDARIGDRAVLAGQVGVGDRKSVGRGARVGGQSGVTRDVPEGAAVSGTPAIPHATWLKAMVHLKHLDELEKRVRVLEAALAEGKKT
jgi:UDP-3-O-[3-hydroxymyristoyl] glucosamine N-acyltransferase